MWYPPFAAGGAGVYAGCLCRELANLGHEVHVITPQFGSERTNQLENGVVVHRIPVIRKPSLWIPCYWFNVRSYYRMLHKKLHFDVLHGNVNGDLTLTRRLVDLPRVVTIHHLGRTSFETLNPSFFELLRNPSGELGFASWIEKKTLDFDKIVIERANKVITVSNFCKQEIAVKYKVPISKISVVQNGIYPEKYVCQEHEIDETRRRLNGDDDFLILSVGRLERRKGLPLLLKAFRLVSQEEKARLIIVGSGEQGPFRQLANSLGIDTRVTFLGSIDDLALKRVYGACDLFVSSSYLEGFGLVLLEAMASGKPIVALDVGGIKEVVKDGVHGKLISCPDSSELADAMMHFAKNRELAERIGKRNRTYVMESFSWTRTAKLTEHLYENLP